jgi:AcrR family transcriptional regulator
MRKQPAQARSRATVDAILEAGAQVLADKGRAGFNTNKVAEVAGVSIGSLYQYFPDKLSLIEAIRKRHLDDVLAVLSQAADASRGGQQLAESLVRGMIAVHTVQPALHRVLLEEAPRYDGTTPVQAAFEAEYASRYRALVEACTGGVKLAGQDVVAQVLAGAMEGVIHSAARNGTLQSPKLKRELVRLVASYLANR